MNKENYRTLSIDIDNPSDQQTLVTISRALSNLDRIKILNLLNDGPLSIMEIANKLNLPVSTTANHIQILDDARLIMTEYTPTLKGHMKLCSRMITHYSVDIWKNKSETIIDIDCGAGYPRKGGKLGCLRLNDMKEFYVNISM